MSNDCWFEAKNISCFKNGFEVVKDLNLKLNYNENVILIGPNGSGKSSLIELINRNIYPVIKDTSVFKLFNKELINIWEIRKRISTVNYDIKTRIDPKLKVIDIIASGLYGKYCKISYKSDKDIYLVENLVQKMYITNLSQKCFFNLSEGEKQIVLIARALINNPDFLILDEPVTNLDLKSKFFVIDQINELSKMNTRIISTTHDLQMITEIYNRVLTIKERKIINDGNQKEVIKRKNINNLFDIDIDIVGKKGNWNVFRKFR